MGKAVMDDAAEDDPGIQKNRINSLNGCRISFFKFVNDLKLLKSALNSC